MRALLLSDNKFCTKIQIFNDRLFSNVCVLKIQRSRFVHEKQKI